MKKNILVVIIIIAAIIGGALIIKNVYSGGVAPVKMPKDIALNGFQYDKDYNFIAPATITFKNIKVEAIPTKIKKEGKTEAGKFYSIKAEVTVETRNKTLNFNYSASTSELFTPQKSNGEIMSSKIMIKTIDGMCYKEVNGKAQNTFGNSFYALTVAPDFSFANFIISNKDKPVTVNGFFRVVKGKFVDVAPIKNMDNVKAFFFENGITAEDYKKVAEEGPIIKYLEKKLGHHPTQKEIENYIKEELNVKP